jgi:NAD(P)-dependent dehydrogenase (short-subunit alcohol dehydrogenase family)
MLEAAAAEAGSTAVPVPCDVTDQPSVQKAIDEAAERLGGIDAVVYATGIGLLARIEDLDVEAWHRLFDTNVIGASLVTTAALPHLQASSGVAAYLSSVAGTYTPPWPGLGGYAVSKAALDQLVEAWRAEHPDVGFTRVIVGDCAGGEGDAMTQFTATWDQDLAGQVMGTWFERRYISGTLMEVDELVRVVDTILRCGASACVPSVAVVPRPPT